MWCCRSPTRRRGPQGPGRPASVRRAPGDQTHRRSRVLEGGRSPLLRQLQSGRRDPAASPLLPGLDGAQPPATPDPPMGSGRATLGRREPGHLPRMLDAFYTAVKSVRSSDVVITGGDLSLRRPSRRPSDAAGAVRARPAVPSTGKLAPARCPNPAALRHPRARPVRLLRPDRPAYWPDDVSIADMWKLTRALAVADRTGRALPRIHHPVWVTEFGWNSWPPTRGRAPLMKRARWIDQAFYELWRQGISTAAWYLIVDRGSRSRLRLDLADRPLLPERAPETPLRGLPLPVLRRPRRAMAGRTFGRSHRTRGRLPSRRSSPGAGRRCSASGCGTRGNRADDRRLRRPAVRAVIGHDASLGWRA